MTNYFLSKNMIVAPTERSGVFHVIASKDATQSNGEIVFLTSAPQPATKRDLSAFGLKG